ncbi:ROK family protein [Chelativorans sp. J32]|uniref:ROK family protein n=1 Tax=Chelativorans sp. J32 TaxID=935840 RepID=UPI000484D26F|nr:ROK family protein [Chelativorans sp. J32]
MFIGIDIGGSSIKIGATDGRDHVLAERAVVMKSLPDYEMLCHAVCAAIKEIAGESGRPLAVGLAMPGFPDPRTGSLRDGGGNIPLFAGRGIVTSLRERLDLPVTVMNDGVAAAMAELQFGAGRGRKTFAVITIGTGIGGCVVVDGRPKLGPNGEPPEFGAMVLDKDGPRNGRGLPGTLESFAAAPSFIRIYRALGGDRHIHHVRSLFERLPEDEIARRAVDAVALRLAQAIGLIANAVNLEACIIGGGVSAAGEMLLEPVRRHLPVFTWPLLLEGLVVCRADFGNRAGMIGAAAHAAGFNRAAATAQR